VLIKNNIYTDKTDSVKGLSVVESQGSNIATMPEPDKDGDGLKDWEELIFGTNPEKKDTDNDGIADKEEYDKSGKSSITQQLLFQKDSNNLTQSAGIELFTQYSSLKQTDSYNATNVDLLADRVVRELQANIKHDAYIAGNLSVLNGANAEAIRAYGNALAGIRDMYFEEYKKSPVESPSGAGIKDPVFIEGMKRVSSIYLQMSKDLMALPVPYEIASTHLDLANNYLNSSITLNETVAGSDPLKSATALGTYVKLQAEESNILASVSLYFQQSGIIFTTDEAGSFWQTQ